MKTIFHYSLYLSISISFAQYNPKLENLNSAIKIIKEADFNIEESLSISSNNFVTNLNRFFANRDSIAQIIYTIDYVHDKSYYSSILDDAMQGENLTHIDTKKRTQYKKPTGVFYIYEITENELVVRFGIATNGNINETNMIGFPIDKDFKSSISKINLSKAKLSVSYQINKYGEPKIVDTIYLATDKKILSVFLGQNSQVVPFPKKELLKKIIEDLSSNLKKSQFETTEEYIGRKINRLGIIDSILSMTFYEPLALSNLTYNADLKLLSFETYDQQSIKCTAKVSVDNAKSIVRQPSISGIGKCLLNASGDIEILDSISISLGNIKIFAEPVFRAIPRTVKSFHVPINRFDILDISTDSLIVLSDIIGESQMLLIYNINTGVLVNRFKKPSTEVLMSRYLNPTAQFMELSKGDDYAQLKFVLWSLSDNSKPIKDINIDLGYRDYVGGSYMDPIKYFKMSYLNNDSTICLAVHMQRKHMLLNTIDASIKIYDDAELESSIYDDGAPPEFMPSGLYLFTSPEKGFLKINKRNSMDEINYSYLRTTSADYYLPLHENVLIDRNNEWVFHFLSSGEEKELKSYYRSLSSANLWNMGDDIVVQDGTQFTVYNPKSDSIVGSFISGETPKLFKYGYVINNLIPETIHVIRFTKH